MHFFIALFFVFKINKSEQQNKLKNDDYILKDLYLLAGRTVQLRIAFIYMTSEFNINQNIIFPSNVSVACVVIVAGCNGGL